MFFEILFLIASILLLVIAFMRFPQWISYMFNRKRTINYFYFIEIYARFSAIYGIK